MLTADCCVLYTSRVLDIYVLNYDQFVQHRNVGMWNRLVHKYHFADIHFFVLRILVVGDNLWYYRREKQRICV
jgi:hypothetical protein